MVYESYLFSGHWVNRKSHPQIEHILSQKKNTKTDQQLEAAAVNNKFDETFVQIIQSSLTTYRTAVKKAFDTTKNKTEKQFLASSYNGTGILINEKLL